MRWDPAVIAAATMMTAGGLSLDCAGTRSDLAAPVGHLDGGFTEHAADKPAACAQIDTTCDGIDDDCDGEIDEDFVPRGAIIKCVDGRACVANDVTCDNVDDDCDGKVDDDYVARIPSCADGCPTARTSCRLGVESTPCGTCGSWPAVAGGWLFYLNAYDFDVAAGKMCLVPLVPTAGPVGGVACTINARGNASEFTVVDVPVGFTDGCDTIKCGNRVTLEADGRVWAARPDGVYRANDTGTLVRVADKPINCETGITAIDIAGSGGEPRPFVICGPTAGAVAAVGRVYELDVSQNFWFDRGFKANTLGASPSRGFDMFFGAPPISESVEMYFVRWDVGLALPRYIGRIGSGSGGQVGGIYMSASGPFVGGFYQWTGTEIVPVSDLTTPLAVENSLLGRYARLAAPGTGHPAAFPYKVVEGGGDGLGGPSPDGQVDVLWILNETLRVESYNLGAIPSGVVGPLDHAPLTR